MKYFIICLAFLCSLVSCSLDELRSSIDNLEERIKELEDYCGQVRSDISGLMDIVDKLQNNVTVDSVTCDDDGYTIHFSDGTSITVHNGEDGLTPPEISVIYENGAYWWGYTYPDGTQEFILDGSGEKIPVSGTAPLVRINEDNYHWEISTDGGRTWSDTGVSATGEGSSIIKEISDDDHYVYITLADGSVLTLPKSQELKCILEADSPLWFRHGEIKEIVCRMSGYQTVTVTKPDGWRAVIDNDILAITAPPAENAFAEQDGAVSLILVSSSGQCLQAELSVSIGTGFDFEIIQNGLSADVTVIPSDNDVSYFTDMIRSQSIASYGETYEEQLSVYVAALADMYLSMGMPAEIVIDMMCQKGEFHRKYESLMPETEYIIYAVPVDSTCSIAGSPFYTTAVTAPSGDATLLSVRFRVTSLTSRTVTVSAVPSDKTVRYWWSIIENGTTAEEIMNGMDTETLLTGSSIGDDSYNFTGLSPQTEYIPYFLGLNRDGEPAGEIVFGEPFYTPEAVTSDAYVEIRYDRYYDGDDIAAAFKDYAKAAGHAFVRLTAYENNTAVDYLYAVLDGDLTEASEYSDEEAIQDLIKAGHNGFMSTYYLDWDTDYTITAVAIDTEGNYGKVFRSHEYFTKDGASPLDGFTPTGIAQSPVKSPYRKD